MAGYSGCDLTNSRLSLVQRHGIDENAGVVTLAVQRSQSSGFTLPDTNLQKVSRDAVLLLVTKYSIT
jgi:hypothetical protein